eukprot:scaffold47933_cov68-Cyclotella_meneghiniana.AAC.2
MLPRPKWRVGVALLVCAHRPTKCRVGYWVAAASFLYAIKVAASWDDGQNIAAAPFAHRPGSCRVYGLSGTEQ